MSAVRPRPELSREHLMTLVPFVEAGRRGLLASRWRPGDNQDDLIAPIVLHVLAEVARQIPMNAVGQPSEGSDR